MMISLGMPAPQVVQNFLSKKESAPYSYPEVGMTKGGPSNVSGYVCDHNRIELGGGAKAFNNAIAALNNWQHFDLGWLEVFNRAPVNTGSLVAVRASSINLHILFACRIVYVLEQSGAIDRYGFAYGTLGGHPECGEELFAVEHDHSTDKVFYELLAFSKPGILLVKMAMPVARALQKQFITDSQQAMIRAVR
jgi:uncharacterized protein (UPF0548 family)